MTEELLNNISNKDRITKLKLDNFPNKKLTKKGIMSLYKQSGTDEKIIEFIRKLPEKVGDIQPPAKCLIVAQSRPFNEIPILNVSIEIQKYIYNLTELGFKKLNIGTSRDQIDRWLSENKIPTHGFNAIQGLNKIIKNAIETYKGVITKVKNKNEKNKSKAKYKNIEFVEEKIFGEDGKLLNPPGININIFSYQKALIEPFNKDKHKIILPQEYNNYSLDKNSIIPSICQNRLEIPKGKPGYIPDWQRNDTNLNKITIIRNRFKKKISKAIKNNDQNQANNLIKEQASGAILAVLIINNENNLKDYIVFDVRGLKRNINFRRIERGLEVNKDLTIINLLDNFSGDPVIHTEHNEIVFRYEENRIPIFAGEIVEKYKTKNKIEKLITNNTNKSNNIILISSDLGENEFITSSFSKISIEDGKLQREILSLPNTKNFTTIKNFYLVGNILSQQGNALFNNYRKDYDLFNKEIRDNAIKTLTKEEQEEIYQVDNDNITNDQIKNKVCETFNIKESEINWKAMDDRSCLISNFALENKRITNNELLYFKTKEENKLKRDRQIYLLFKKKLSKETRSKLNEAIWQLQKDNLKYKSFVTRKIQITRYIINELINIAKNYDNSIPIMIAIENLNLNNSFASGSGRRDTGWNNFSKPKSEKRWFMQIFHKVFKEQINKGINICLANKAFTSRTCPECLNSNIKNRNGINFKCVNLNCSFQCHSDLLGSYNIGKAALCGDVIEHWDDEEAAAGARKHKSSKLLKKNG